LEGVEPLVKVAKEMSAALREVCGPAALRLSIEGLSSDIPRVVIRHAACSEAQQRALDLESVARFHVPEVEVIEDCETQPVPEQTESGKESAAEQKHDEPFFKMSAGVVDSSLWWNESAQTLKMMLYAIRKASELTGPRDGTFRMADAGLFRVCGLTPEEGRASLERLLGPDLESRSKEHEGRRLERIAGGFRILNWKAYHSDDESRAAYQQRRKEESRLAALVRWHREGKHTDKNVLGCPSCRG
jgi:hypothetical protein